MEKPTKEVITVLTDAKEEGRLSAFKEMEKFAFENEKKEFKERGFLMQRGKYYAFRKMRKFAEAKMKEKKE